MNANDGLRLCFERTRSCATKIQSRPSSQCTAPTYTSTPSCWYSPQRAGSCTRKSIVISINLDSRAGRLSRSFGRRPPARARILYISAKFCKQLRRGSSRIFGRCTLERHTCNILYRRRTFRRSSFAGLHRASGHQSASRTFERLSSRTWRHMCLIYGQGQV